MRGWIGCGLVVAGLVAGGTRLWAGSAGNTEEMVGASRCRDCHRTAFEVWAQSRHARSHKALDDKQAADPRCSQCHGVIEAGLAAVQCEDCHGPGRYYAFRYVMRDEVLSRIVGLTDPDEKTCLRCHTSTSPSIRPYDHRRMWSLVAHGQDPKPEPKATPKDATTAPAPTSSR